MNDDFQKVEDHWFWRADGNQHIPIVEDGLLKLNLKNAIASEYCNTEIYNPSEPYSSGTQARIRLKASEIHTGSRGWGFWDGDLDLSVLLDFDVAWVMQQASDNSSSNYNWFLFGVDGDKLENRKTIDLNPILNENIWHTYKIIWDENFVSFSVDDALLFTSTENLPDQNMRLDIWIDNRVINISNPSEFWNNNVDNSEMYVDFVEISGLDGPSINRNQKGSVILWDSPNTYPNGDVNHKWIEKQFQVNFSGETLFFITGLVENYNDLLPCDELKLVIDDNDPGWNGPHLLNGDKLHSTGSSIVVSNQLSEGEHKLELFSNQTPFVRDIIIANSPNGKIIFNQKYDQKIQTPDGIFKEIILNSDVATSATIFVSGTADSGSGMKFGLNDIDFGWSDENSINGDLLNNFPNTVALVADLEQGTNKFRIISKGEPEIYSVAIYSSDLVTKVADSSTPEEEISLNINPNPFNNSTLIKYSTNTNSRNKVNIYNSLGQKVSTLLNAEQNAGEHHIFWDASKLSSGVYFCVLESGHHIQIEKLLLLK